MRKAVAILSVFLFAAHVLSAQIVIEGSVRDEEGAAIRGAVVTLSQQGGILAYGTTGREGGYRLTIPKGTGQATVTFNHLTFEKREVPVTMESRRLDVILRERTEMLREVTVTAPVVKLRGDTLSFWLPGLMALEDYTLEDAMKRIPGIEVGSNGRITYQGRAISHFYIDGVDILGGKYTLATRGIPAEMVNEVEVLDNHHSIKMERHTGRTDEVALNIRLNDKARIKPIGSSEVRAGWGNDGALWRLGGSLMRFGGQNQAILSAKAGNDTQFAMSETSDFFASNRISGLASAFAGSVSGSMPPLDTRYFLRPMDAYISLDTSHKRSEDARLRLNAHYAYGFGTYEYGTRSDYYAGEEILTLQEHFAPSSTVHVPSVGLEYQVNADDRFLNEHFLATANFVTDILATERNGEALDQHSQTRTIQLQNSLDWRKLIGGRRVSFRNLVKWTAMPFVQYHFAGLGLNGRQSAGSHNLQMKQSIHSARDWRRLTVRLPLDITLAYDRIDSRLEFNDFSSKGNIDGIDGSALFSPWLRWQSQSQRLQAEMSVDLGVRGLSFRNLPDGAIEKRLLPVLDPNLSLDLTVSPRSQIRLSARSIRTMGDLLDFLGTPVMTSYRSVQTRPGILRDGRSNRLTLAYDWKRPIELWFFHADASASRNMANQRNAQTVETERIWTTSLPEPVLSDAISISGTLSKRFQRTSTKLVLGAYGSGSRNSITQQGQAIDYLGDVLRLNWEASTAPWKWISLTYRGNWSRTGSSYLGGRSAFVTQSHSGTLSIFPVSGLRVYFDADYVDTQITEDRFKQMLLGQTGLEWRKGKIRASLHVHNLFDTRNYTYSVFTGLDTFSYDFALRGREILFSLTYTL